MMHEKHVKLMVTAMFVALACSLIVSGLFDGRITPVAAATPGKSLGTKMVYIETQYQVDAVTITKVTVGGQQIQPGESTAGARVVKLATPFQADEDWLRNMSISLTNRTDKVIVRAEIELYFPDTGDGSAAQPITTYNMTLGQRPEVDSYASHGQKLMPEPAKQPVLLAPGQTLVIPVTDYVDAMQSRVEEKLAFSQVTRVAIRRLLAYFVDGMRWTDLDGFGVPDPNHPGQFTNMDRARYFPGNRDQNWPPGK